MAQSLNLEIVLYVVIIFILFIILWNMINKKSKEYFNNSVDCSKCVVNNGVCVVKPPPPEPPKCRSATQQKCRQYGGTMSRYCNSIFSSGCCQLAPDNITCNRTSKL
jgi:hypothetical protein